MSNLECKGVYNRGNGAVNNVTYENGSDHTAYNVM
jgi:hypothetical protein